MISILRNQNTDEKDCLITSWESFCSSSSKQKSEIENWKYWQHFWIFLNGWNLTSSQQKECSKIVEHFFPWFNAKDTPTKAAPSMIKCFKYFFSDKSSSIFPHFFFKSKCYVLSAWSFPRNSASTFFPAENFWRQASKHTGKLRQAATRSRKQRRSSKQAGPGQRQRRWPEMWARLALQSRLIQAQERAWKNICVFFASATTLATPSGSRRKRAGVKRTSLVVKRETKTDQYFYGSVNYMQSTVLFAISQ